MNIKILSLLVFSLILSVNADFPDNPKPCKYRDSKCIKPIINFLLKEKYKGEPSLNLRQIGPLKLESAHIHQGEESPVSLDLELKNNNIYGLETGTAVKVKGFDKDITKRNNLVIHTDYLTAVGDYTINGKILVLPIKGNGKSNITMVDVNLFIDFVGVPYEKDGATYMKIDKLHLDADPKFMTVKVENLFNGDKALGDNMNLFLNENWKEIYNEVRVPLATAFSDIFADIINEIFSKYPYEKFFAE